jgi:hypothetical protein
VRIRFFLRANAPVLTPQPEHVGADIESVGPRDDFVIDECPRVDTFVHKRLGSPTRLLVGVTIIDRTQLSQLTKM